MQKWKNGLLAASLIILGGCQGSSSNAAPKIEQNVQGWIDAMKQGNLAQADEYILESSTTFFVENKPKKILDIFTGLQSQLDPDFSLDEDSFIQEMAEILGPVIFASDSIENIDVDEDMAIARVQIEGVELNAAFTDALDGFTFDDLKNTASFKKKYEAELEKLPKEKRTWSFGLANILDNWKITAITGDMADGFFDVFIGDTILPENIAGYFSNEIDASEIENAGQQDDPEIWDDVNPDIIEPVSNWLWYVYYREYDEADAYTDGLETKKMFTYEQLEDIHLNWVNFDFQTDDVIMTNDTEAKVHVGNDELNLLFTVALTMNGWLIEDIQLT